MASSLFLVGRHGEAKASPCFFLYGHQNQLHFDANKDYSRAIEMTVYAEKRADFHRHSRAIEVRLMAAIRSLKGSPNVVKRLAARRTFSFLLIDAENLRFGAQIVDMSAMVNKLDSMKLLIERESAANETHIEALAQRQRRSAAERLQREAEQYASKTIGTSHRKGVTLLEDSAQPILFSSFKNVVAHETIHPVYTVWNTDDAVAASFTSSPYQHLDWTPVPRAANLSPIINSILRSDGFLRA